MHEGWIPPIELTSRMNIIESLLAPHSQYHICKHTVKQFTASLNFPKKLIPICARFYQNYLNDFYDVFYIVIYILMWKC